MQRHLERLALKAELAQNHYLLQQQKSWPQIQSRNQIYCLVGSQGLLNLEINSIITSVRELINRNATNLLHKCRSAKIRLHTCCFESETDNLNQSSTGVGNPKGPLKGPHERNHFFDPQLMQIDANDWSNLEHHLHQFQPSLCCQHGYRIYL